MERDKARNKNGLLMIKVKILFNKKIWNVSKQIAAIQKFYSMIPMTFELEKVDFDLSGKWSSNDKMLKTYFAKSLVDNSADVFVLNVLPEDWEAKKYIGYCQNLEGTQAFIGMMSGAGRKRDRTNQGWCNDDEFAGRLRHELGHYFYHKSKQEDKLHFFDYDKKQIDLILSDIDFEKIKALFPKSENMPILQLPMPNDRPDAGYQFLDPLIDQDGFHPGIDINAGDSAFADFNREVKSPGRGTVVFTSYASGWGNMIVVYLEEVSRVLGFDVWARMAHFNSVYVKVGQKVDMNTIIGRCGKTGTQSPHVHFDLIKKRLANWLSYVGGWSKADILKVYLDPMATIELVNQAKSIPEWALNNWNRAKVEGLGIEDPFEEIDIVKLQKIAQKLGLIKEVGKMPAYRAIEMLYRWKDEI